MITIKQTQTGAWSATSDQHPMLLVVGTNIKDVADQIQDDLAEIDANAKREAYENTIVAGGVYEFMEPTRGFDLKRGDRVVVLYTDVRFGDQGNLDLCVVYRYPNGILKARRNSEFIKHSTGHRRYRRVA